MPSAVRRCIYVAYANQQMIKYTFTSISTLAVIVVVVVPVSDFFYLHVFVSCIILLKVHIDPYIQFCVNEESANRRAMHRSGHVHSKSDS